MLLLLAMSTYVLVTDKDCGIIATAFSGEWSIITVMIPLAKRQAKMPLICASRSVETRSSNTSGRMGKTIGLTQRICIMGEMLKQLHTL